MNRNNEYNELMRQLEDTPLKLDFTMERARAKKAVSEKRNRVKKAIWGSFGTVVALFVIFSALINFYSPFAEACSKIPVINEFAEAVSMSPSLSAALKNNYMQEIGLERTKNDVTAKIEYVIVNQKQLNIFYSLSSDKYSEMEVRDVYTNFDEGCTILSSNSPQIEDGNLRKIVVDFEDGYNMPNTLYITIKVYDTKGTYESNLVEEVDGTNNEQESPSPEYITEFDFTLNFDPSFTAKGEVLQKPEVFQTSGFILKTGSSGLSRAYHPEHPAL